MKKYIYYLFFLILSLLFINCGRSSPYFKIEGFLEQKTQYTSKDKISIVCYRYCPNPQTHFRVIALDESLHYDFNTSVKIKWQVKDNVIMLSPDSTWNAPKRYQIVSSDYVLAPEMIFSVKDEESVFSFKIWPSPELELSLYPAWLMIQLSDSLHMDTIKDMRLISQNQVIQILPVKTYSTSQGTQIEMTAPILDSRCHTQGLCPNEDYTLQSQDLLFKPQDTTDSAKDWYNVATWHTTKNNTPQNKQTESSSLQFTNSGQIINADTYAIIKRKTSQPCLIKQIFNTRAQPVLINGWLDFSNGEATLSSLQPFSSYDIDVICVDNTGARTPIWPIHIQTQTPTRILISEIVVEPKQNWNDSSSGNHIPFDHVVGTQNVNFNDEWIELYNDGDHAVDLSAWTIEVKDRDLSFVTIGDFAKSQPIQIYSSNNNATLNSHEYMVVKLSKSGKNATSSARIRLYDQDKTVKDEWVLGQGKIPSGQASGVQDESIARCLIHDKNEQALYVKTKATPKAPNLCP